MLVAHLRSSLTHKLRWSCLGCRNSYHSITNYCPKPDCREVKGHTLYKMEKIITSELDLMLAEVVSWDAATQDWRYDRQAAPCTHNILNHLPAVVCKGKDCG